MTKRFIVTTRPADKDEPLDCPGLDVENFPVTELVPLPVDWDSLISFHPQVLIFTSSYSAKIACHMLQKFPDAEKVSIGRATAEAILECGAQSYVPSIMTSEGVVALISEKAWHGKRIAIFSSAKSNMIIRNFLASGGYDFRFYALYDSVEKDLSGLPQLLTRPGCVGIIFTSSQEASIVLQQSSVSNFIKSHGVKTYAIGPVTAMTMKKLGFPPADPQGNSDLVELLCRIAHQNP